MQRTVSKPHAKETRISVRIKPAQKALIARAARLRQSTLTEFVLENALRAASEVVAEEKHFEISPEQAFTDMTPLVTMLIDNGAIAPVAA